MSCGLRAAWRRLVHAYEATQVELRGNYSVERMLQLDEYASSCSLAWCVLVMVATPLPCLATSIITDTVPLRPSREGFARSQLFWWRVSLVAACVTYAIFEQLRCFVPRLPNFTRLSTFAMTVLVALGCSAYGIFLASFVGYPLPFTLFFCSPSWQVLFWACVAAKWGRLLYHDRALRQEVVSFYKVVVVQLSLTVVYPAYNHVFTTLDGQAQTACALVLPVLKMLAKNGVYRVFRHAEDFRPEVVIFNVEIFHALFVSACMQSSRSPSTTAVIMTADAIQAWAHVVDIDAMLSTLKSLDDKIMPEDPHAVATLVSPLKKALLYVSMDPALQTDPAIRLRSMASCVHPAPLINTSDRPTAGRQFRLPPPSPHRPNFATIHPVASVHGPAQAETASVVAQLRRYTQSISSRDIKALHEALTEDQRREYVARVLRVLHFTEFLVLIEFVEVVVPLVYCVYLAAVYHMPNRIHYPQLENMDDAQLWSTVANISGYTLLELVSFVCLCLVLRRKLHMSPTRQLVFVLHKQWKLVQSKMILWVLVVVETSLEQFGYDYTFKFAWLKTSP